jgi:hypothetical protein
MALMYDHARWNAEFKVAPYHLGELKTSNAVEWALKGLKILSSIQLLHFAPPYRQIINELSMTCS